MHKVYASSAWATGTRTNGTSSPGGTSTATSMARAAVGGAAKPMDGFGSGSVTGKAVAGSAVSGCSGGRGGLATRGAGSPVSRWPRPIWGWVSVALAALEAEGKDDDTERDGDGRITASTESWAMDCASGGAGVVFDPATRALGAALSRSTTAGAVLGVWPSRESTTAKASEPQKTKQRRRRRFTAKRKAGGDGTRQPWMGTEL